MLPSPNHEAAIRKNETEPYGMAWIDAYNILLSEQKANHKTKRLGRSLFHEKQKEEKV